MLFEYLSFGTKLNRKQTEIAKQQYQGLDNTFKFEKKLMKQQIKIIKNQHLKSEINHI